MKKINTIIGLSAMGLAATMSGCNKSSSKVDSCVDNIVYSEDVEELVEKVEDLNEKIQLLESIHATKGIEKYMNKIDYSKVYDNIDFDNEVIKEAINLYDELDAKTSLFRDQKEQKELDSYGKYLALSEKQLNEYLYNYGYDIAKDYTDVVIKGKLIDYVDELELPDFENIDYTVDSDPNAYIYSINVEKNDEQLKRINLNKTDFEVLAEAYRKVKIAQKSKTNKPIEEYNDERKKTIENAIEISNKFVNKAIKQETLEKKLTK